ncbi:hypothetical protein LOTGIDRAFT_212084 [Lottia gigantea]|uniref:Target of rapamycin complex subunit lst8 n=1 Tax=Lottia gigantea TaxID=225164 RepID=V4B0Y3_LOTGI|nr:hypothetical protein LOTGIDRAFT_212084 [Lottia gigantea]ESP03913.1 hypothetical protein LOTGIDRAFT_212084 [Lottia gigantea]
MSGIPEPVVLATAGYDHTIRFWQAHTGLCYRTVQHPDSQVNALEITPDKKRIAAAGYTHIRIYDINSNNPNAIINYDGVPKNVVEVGFHDEGNWMFTGGEDCTARIWDLRARNLQCSRIFQVHSPVTCVCLHPNQAELFVGDQGGSIHIWDLKTDKNERLVPEGTTAIQSITIDAMGTMMAATNIKGNCFIWTLTGGKGDKPTELHPKSQFKAHEKYVLKCLFSPDSTLLATTSADGSCVIWRTTDLTKFRILKEKTQRWVWDCAFSDDSVYIVTASSDNMARLWHIEEEKIEREYSGHQKAVVCLALRDENIP